MNAVKESLKLLMRVLSVCMTVRTDINISTTVTPYIKLNN